MGEYIEDAENMGVNKEEMLDADTLDHLVSSADDIVLFADDLEHLLVMAKKLFAVLRSRNVQLKPSKIRFGFQEVEFWGDSWSFWFGAFGRFPMALRLFFVGSSLDSVGLRRAASDGVRWRHMASSRPPPNIATIEPT